LSLSTVGAMVSGAENVEFFFMWLFEHTARIPE
jgi:hypothetical protein